MGTFRTYDISHALRNDFDDAYERYHQAIYFNIFKIVQDDSVAEDLLQDVFLAFWENLHRLEKDRFANWLFVVSFNKSLSYIKKLAKKSFSPIADLEQVDEIPEIDEEEFEEKILIIHNAIELLPSQKKHIFKQYRIEGKSLEQIATDTQLSINTVKDHLKVANKMLRDHIARVTANPVTDWALFLIAALHF